MTVEALDLLYYSCGYKYQTRERIRFRLPIEFEAYTVDTRFIALNDCVLTLAAGYAGDGPSGPTADSKCSMRAAMLHDAGYQLLREGYLPHTMKDLIDSLFHELLLADGMGRIRAWLWYQGVKRFGKSSTIHNRDILCAP